MYYRHSDELLFEKIKYLYQPIDGTAIILDLELYKKGIRQTYVFDIESTIYYEFINSEMASTHRETIIWTSIKRKSVSMYSKKVIIDFDLESKSIDRYEDLNYRPHFVKLSIKQQAELLIFQLNNPEPEKPDC